LALSGGANSSLNPEPVKPTKMAEAGVEMLEKSLARCYDKVDGSRM
jgi:hypothetical protein